MDILTTNEKRRSDKRLSQPQLTAYDNYKGEYTMSAKFKAVDVFEKMTEMVMLDTYWMSKLCWDCPQRHDCPVDGDPFYELGCLKSDYIEDLEDAAKALQDRLDDVERACVPSVEA